MMRFVLAIILMGCCLKSNGQNVEAGLKLFPNLLSNNAQYESATSVLALNGGGLFFNYKNTYKQSKFNYNLGVEFSFTDWGAQIVSRLGANTQINKSIGVEVLLLNGIALYVDNSGYLFGAEANAFYLISIKNKKRIKLNAGLRFTQNPKYKAIGNYSFLDLPVSISWLFGNTNKGL